MQTAEIDTILLLQLTVARLGEKELLAWWNTDICYKLGGADFLNRLVGPVLAPLAAGEAILMAASLKEEKLIKAISGADAFSLFWPEPEARAALGRRLRHFKTYPDELPADIAEILDPGREWKSGELLERLTGGPKVSFQGTKFQGTSFGREVSVAAAWGAVRKAQALASTFSAGDRGAYVMPYYRSGDAS